MISPSFDATKIEGITQILAILRHFWVIIETL